MSDAPLPSLDLLIAADHANFSLDSKLYIAGEFSEVRAARVPTVLPALSVVFRIRAPKRWALSRHTVRLQLVSDLGGTVVLARESVLEEASPESLPMQPVDGWVPESVELTQLSNITGLVLPQYGPYSFEVLVDGVKIGSRRLAVVRQSDAESTTEQAPATDRE